MIYIFIWLWFSFVYENFSHLSDILKPSLTKNKTEMQFKTKKKWILDFSLILLSVILKTIHEEI